MFEQLERHPPPGTLGTDLDAHRRHSARDLIGRISLQKIDAAGRRSNENGRLRLC